MGFRQLFREMLKRGEEPRYIVKNVNKPPKAKMFKKRGIGWTRPDKRRSKAKRKMANASRHANRKRS